jgi:hypothetical protein
MADFDKQKLSTNSDLNYLFAKVLSVSLYCVFSKNKSVLCLICLFSKFLSLQNWCEIID